MKTNLVGPSAFHRIVSDIGVPGGRLLGGDVGEFRAVAVGVLSV